MPDWTALGVLRTQIDELNANGRMTAEQFTAIYTAAKKQCEDFPRALEAFVRRAPVEWLEQHWFQPLDALASSTPDTARVASLPRSPAHNSRPSPKRSSVPISKPYRSVNAKFGSIHGQSKLGPLAKPQAKAATKPAAKAAVKPAAKIAPSKRSQVARVKPK